MATKQPGAAQSEPKAAAELADADGPLDLRNQLLKRLAVAGVLVAVLLGTLAFFDYLSQPAEDDELPVFNEPVPVGGQKLQTQPVTPAEIQPPPGVELPAGQVAPADATSAAGTQSPVPAPAATVEPPPAPVVEAQPALAATPGREGSAAAPSRQASRPTTPRTSPAPAVPEYSAAPPIVPGRPVASPPASVSASPVQLPASQPARASSPPPPAPATRLFSGFVLQAGVFSSAERAEELHAKLSLNGVPSSVETRVQVGPFKTRQEAEQAQRKLRDLGIESILVPPRGQR